MLMLLTGFAIAVDDARLLREPDISGDNIVFVYGGDLWTVGKDGGNAVQLTTQIGAESAPHYSPDGKWIAFSGNYDGNNDVYIIPVIGGVPKRLTYHPNADLVIGWSKDGKEVLFNSVRDSYNSRFTRIFKVSVEGGMPAELPLPYGYDGDISKDGKMLAYNHIAPAFRWWRNYRGGRASYINILKFADNSITKVPRTRANDAFPEWIGNTIYFMSDRDRVMNIWKYEPGAEKPEQVTFIKNSDIKSFGTDGAELVVSQDGYLHLLDTNTGKHNKITVNVPTEGLNIRPHFVKVARQIRYSGISPTGKRAVFEARGEILTVPAKDGNIRNITNSPGNMERSPAWSPDGKRIAWFGEYEGEYALIITDQFGKNKPEVITFEEHRYFSEMKWSPDSGKILFTDQRCNLYYIDLKDKKPVKIDGDYYFSGYGSGTLSSSWSPDSKWIAYAKLQKKFMRDIYLYSLENGKSYLVTDGMAEADNPAFDQNGKYLYFSVSTNKGVDVGSDMSEFPHHPTASLYAVVLSADEPSPLKPESDEEEAAKADKKKHKKKDKKEDKSTKIDLENIGHRIVALKAPAAEIHSLSAGKDKLFYLTLNRSNFTSSLHMYDIKKNKDEVLGGGLSGYDLSADGKKMLISMRGRYAIVDAGKKIKPGDGSLGTSSMEVYTDPRAEWAQMLFEAWRIERDFFYDPGMHGRDWPAVWEKYKTYLPYISHRDDLNYVIGMLIGELTIGHAYVFGGDLPRADRVPGGLLGVDFAVEDGLYKFKKIYRGENWNPDLRSPLTEPGIKVKEGDYLLEVNGIALKAPTNPYALFQNTAGKQVRIKVNSKPEMTGAKTVTVVPVQSEVTLRHREWIENNRKKVEKLSNGRLGYGFIPNTSSAGYRYFERYFFAHTDKQGFILDERFNGGGYPADYIIDMMGRSLFNMVKYRTHPSVPMPTAAVYGPKAMLINEWSASGGDIIAIYFRDRKLGKMIGRRTWGGVVGLSGYPALMDGGFVTSPTMAIVTEKEGFDVENRGIAPDIDIEITPADYVAGRDPQLEKAIEVLLEDLKKNPPEKFKMPPYPRNR